MKSQKKEFGPGHEGKWLVACSHWSKPRIVRAKTAAEAARECGVLLSECDQVRPYYEEGTKEAGSGKLEARNSEEES